MNSFLLQFEEEKCSRGCKRAVASVFSFREIKVLLFRFPGIRIVGLLRAKK